MQTSNRRPHSAGASAWPNPSPSTGHWHYHRHAIIKNHLPVVCIHAHFHADGEGALHHAFAPTNANVRQTEGSCTHIGE